MSRKFLVLCLATITALTTTGISFAQVSISEPEYVGNIVAVQGSEALTLEKQRASNHARSGFLKAKGSNIVQGATSPIRLSTGEPLEFVVRASTNDVDPVQVINIFQLTSDKRKDYRYIETSSRGLFSGDSMAIKFLPFTSKRFGESSYLINLGQGLEPGEYAMTLDGSRDVFNLFGVD